MGGRSILRVLLWLIAMTAACGGCACARRSLPDDPTSAGGLTPSDPGRRGLQVPRAYLEGRGAQERPVEILRTLGSCPALAPNRNRIQIREVRFYARQSVGSSDGDGPW
jgi:hypothetical protein